MGRVDDAGARAGIKTPDMSHLPGFWLLIRRRLEDACREIGILLVAFAPLDLAFSDATQRRGVAAFFAGVGVLAFCVAIVAEVRRTNDG